jgi:hypothetical protein
MMDRRPDETLWGKDIPGSDALRHETSSLMEQRQQGRTVRRPEADYSRRVRMIVEGQEAR